MNKKINKFLLAGDKFMPEIELSPAGNIPEILGSVPRTLQYSGHPGNFSRKIFFNKFLIEKVFFC